MLFDSIPFSKNGTVIFSCHSKSEIITINETGMLNLLKSEPYHSTYFIKACLPSEMLHWLFNQVTKETRWTDFIKACGTSIDDVVNLKEGQSSNCKDLFLRKCDNPNGICTFLFKKLAHRWTCLDDHLTKIAQTLALKSIQIKTENFSVTTRNKKSNCNL